MFFTQTRLLFCVLLLAAAVPVFADDAPPWFRQAAGFPVPVYEKDVDAVVLLDEEQVTLDAAGKLVTVENYAVKLLNPEGRRYAVAQASYLVSSGGIRDIQAWLIRPDGTVKTFDKKSVLDIISDPDDVYNEGRLKIIDASNEVDKGSVFGYTVVSDDTPLFYQDVWGFQGTLPVIVSRYSLNLPQGWKATSTTFNVPEVKPSVNGTNYSWELRNLAPIPVEPMSPSIVNLAPRIAVNYAPESNAPTINRVFTNWEDVSRWATGLHDSQTIVDGTVAAKAAELTASAKTELEKIRAIGQYVQSLQYISIDIGVGHGNGYKPRPSDLVLKRGYGDCKDKANLMRAMLRSLKIDAYPVAIFSGDRTFVREEWASPRQFNHCIIAVKVGDTTVGPTVITHAKLGRLLIFDATDPYTPVGDLPDHLQGSLALIAAGNNGGLAKMPVTPPESDRLDRNVEVNLSSTGVLSGKILERASGQTSTIFRRELREYSASDYKKALEAWLTRGSTGAKLVSHLPKDKQSEAGFDLDVEFSAPGYAQLMQNRLLVFKPVVVGRRNAVWLTESKRTNPIELDSHAMKETAVFTLPTGFVIDELPEAVNLDTDFGKYSTSIVEKEGKLVFTRSLVMNRVTVTPDKYTKVKDFFTKMLEAEQLPVVLLKK